MRAASREAYAAVSDALETRVTGGAGAADLAGLADEVLAVAGLLGREPGLRRSLADANRSADDRRQLLSGLLSEKVSAGALELLDTLVGGRWSTPGEMLDGTERLGVAALLASADADGALSDVEDELFRFNQVVAGNSALQAALSDPTADPQPRVELATGLLDGKARPATVRLVALAVRGFGGRTLEGALSRLVELAAERRERSVAYVTVAAPMGDEQERRLAAELSRRYGREVTTKVTVDPAVLGGISVRVGYDLYDGTVSHRLAETQQALGRR